MKQQAFRFFSLFCTLLLADAKSNVNPNPTRVAGLDDAFSVQEEYAPSRTCNNTELNNDMAMNGNLETELMAGNCQIDSIDEDGWTALIRAVCEGHLSTVESLLAAEPNLDIDMQDMMGYTPLINSASRGHQSILQVLVAAGASLDMQDMDGQVKSSIVAYHKNTRARRVS